MSNTPRPGTPGLAAVAQYMLVRNTKVWAVPTLTAVSVDQYGATIQFGDDKSAKDAAEMLGMGDSEVEFEVTEGSTLTVRIGHVEGIRVRVVACWVSP